MKTNFHNKDCGVSLAFIMRFTVTRKWPICDHLYDVYFTPCVTVHRLITREAWAGRFNNSVKYRFFRRRRCRIFLFSSS